MCLIASGIHLDPLWGGLHQVPPLPTVRLLLVSHAGRDTQAVSLVVGVGMTLSSVGGCLLQQL